MKIFISDLHLGDGSRTDDFHRDKEFLEFLEFVESQGAGINYFRGFSGIVAGRFRQSNVST
jgi:UDP-2,3-diacylglucosamine pyrophosphatase LpxH